MRYIVHFKYPIMFWNKDHLAPVRSLDYSKEPHIITQDGERYVELPRVRYKIGEDPTRGSMLFVPITYYTLDDTPSPSSE